MFRAVQLQFDSRPYMYNRKTYPVKEWNVKKAAAIFIYYRVLFNGRKNESPILISIYYILSGTWYFSARTLKK